MTLCEFLVELHQQLTAQSSIVVHGKRIMRYDWKQSEDYASLCCVASSILRLS